MAESAQTCGNLDTLTAILCEGAHESSEDRLIELYFRQVGPTVQCPYAILFTVIGLMRRDCAVGIRRRLVGAGQQMKAPRRFLAGCQRLWVDDLAIPAVYDVPVLIIECCRQMIRGVRCVLMERASYRRMGGS